MDMNDRVMLIHPLVWRDVPDARVSSVPELGALHPLPEHDLASRSRDATRLRRDSPSALALAEPTSSAGPTSVPHPPLEPPPLPHPPPFTWRRGVRPMTTIVTDNCQGCRFTDSLRCVRSPVSTATTGCCTSTTRCASSAARAFRSVRCMRSTPTTTSPRTSGTGSRSMPSVPRRCRSSATSGSPSRGQRSAKQRSATDAGRAAAWTRWQPKPIRLG